MPDVPVDGVIEMRKTGMSNNQIAKSLGEQAFSSEQISAAITQADIKSGIDPPNNPQGEASAGKPSVMYEEAPAPAPEVPTPPVPAAPAPAMPVMPAAAPPMEEVSERIHEVAEAIVSEKIDELVTRWGDMPIWKEKVSTDIISIKQELVRVEERFSTLQKAILGRVEEYDKHIIEVRTEMEALEKVFGKIIEPLTTNIKELSKITEKLKTKKV